MVAHVCNVLDRTESKEMSGYSNRQKVSQKFVVLVISNVSLRITILFTSKQL